MKETKWPPLKKTPARNTALFFFVLFVGLFIIFASLNYISIVTGGSIEGILTFNYSSYKTLKQSRRHPNRSQIPLNCSSGKLTLTCPASLPVTFETKEGDYSSTGVCPDYFRWIQEDLRPWSETGITREMVERAQRTANFRLVTVNGTAYLEKYQKSIDTRDLFTLWGILQLLRRYPGRLPDLDLMFDCEDRPVVISRDFGEPNGMAPPPLFRYCGDEWTLDIVFPDWSFWGWAEINIKPWESLLEELKEGNRRRKWVEREAYAYWRGNPSVAPTRGELLRCNVSDEQDWNARLYTQDWISESEKGYKQSNLADQCTHRYKIYIEGWAWSVSEKYILACDSPTLLVKSRYYDFFTRSLVPLRDYWPIRDDDKCRSIKFAVDWGNNNQQKAQAIGKAASNFIQDDLKMDYVYDYMFHLLNEYAKLLRYKPTIPERAIELCSEIMVCPADGLEKKFMMDSMAKFPADTSPCTMPSHFVPPTQVFLATKANATSQVELWEKTSWENQAKQL